MQVTKEQQRLFTEAFLQTQQKLGLLDYKVYFRYDQDLPDDYAQVTTDHCGRVVTVYLCKELSKENATDFNPAEHGKHEAIHLLTGRLAWLARCRFSVDPDQIEEAEHEIIRVIERFI